MAFEDAAVRGTLFVKVQHKSQLPDILSISERLRKPRTTAVRIRNSAMRDPFEFVDGPLQQERDRQLLHQKPFDGFVIPGGSSPLEFPIQSRCICRSGRGRGRLS